jgi:hypothetical protein
VEWLSLFNQQHLYTQTTNTEERAIEHENL